MTRADKGLLSFEGSKHPHHIESAQDVAEELFALLTEAKTVYLQEVKSTANSIAVMWRIL